MRFAGRLKLITRNDAGSVDHDFLLLKLGQKELLTHLPARLDVVLINAKKIFLFRAHRATRINRLCGATRVNNSSSIRKALIVAECLSC